MKYGLLKQPEDRTILRLKRELWITRGLLAILIVIACRAKAQSIAYCPDTGSQAFVASGGVVAYIMVETNSAQATSVVLPVGVKMFDAATNSPDWTNRPSFGPKVTVLPMLSIEASKGYMYYGPDRNLYGYPMVYSYEYPIQVLSSANGGPTAIQFHLVLVGGTTESLGCEYPYYYGYVKGSLLNSSEDVMMERAGTNGVCHYGMERTNQVDLASRSVVVLYFNLPMANYCCVPDSEHTNNWPNYPYPCPATSQSSNIYRLRCNGSRNCQ